MAVKSRLSDRWTIAEKGHYAHRVSQLAAHQSVVAVVVVVVVVVLIVAVEVVQ